jgi:hypothetical protein
MFGLLGSHRVAVLASVVAMAAGAGGTAIALGVSSPRAAPPSHVVSVPLDGRTRALLKVTSGTAILHVSVARMPGTLLRVSTPDDAPVRPLVSGSAPVVLSLAHDDADRDDADRGRGAPYAVTVVLSPEVLWGLDFAGGTQRTTADLRGGRVAGIVVTAGSDIVSIALPRPAGTMSIQLAGGASRFLVSLPGGVPARVTAHGGAGQVIVDAQDRTGVAGGTVIASPDWAAATSRLDVDATAGVSVLQVSRWPAPASAGS